MAVGAESDPKHAIEFTDQESQPSKPYAGLLMPSENSSKRYEAQIKSDFALFTGRASANFEGQRGGARFFPQAYVAATRFVCEVTLRDLEMTRAQDFDRQMFDQEFPLDLARGNVVWTAHITDSIGSSENAKLYWRRDAKPVTRSFICHKIVSYPCLPSFVASDYGQQRHEDESAFHLCA